MAARARRQSPTLDVESELWSHDNGLVAGMDEVGRGAWAGPLAVGVTVLTADCPPIPDGLADSKFLSEKRREQMVPVVEGWVLAWAIGEASAEEIDRLGVTVALRIAGRRALDSLPVVPDVVILDGSHNYLTGPVDASLLLAGRPVPAVRTEVKGDARCAAVSAASVLAKSYRDRLMADLAVDHPHYGWERNAGYGGAAEHIAGVVTHGLSSQHRRSWKVPPAARSAIV